MTAAELQARYPYMFEGANIGLDFHEGWLPILSSACEKVDAILGAEKRGFHFVQIKEKFGSGRFYPGSAALSAEVWDQVFAVLHSAEKETQSACMRCGAPARIERHGGWYACLCDFHAAEWLARREAP